MSGELVARIRTPLHDRKTETRQPMNYSLPPDAITYEFNPHTLTALVCLMAALVILLIRVIIDHTDSAKGSNGKK